MIEARIVADSLAPSGVRLTTFVLTYPRFIHSEFMTHRMFSRNASSSRAIPVKRQIQMVIDNPAIPLSFTKNQKGMQGGIPILEQEKAVKNWLDARDAAVKFADVFSDLDVHKQYANRILEPFAHITVVCTATDWANFFALRIHYAAQPEICELASLMQELYFEDGPLTLDENEWHLPFIDSGTWWETLDYSIQKNKEVPQSASKTKLLIQRSVARCARVSYLNHDGKISTLEEDLSLYNRLLGQIPIHASPAEHQAMAISDSNVRSGNFRGWIQYRKTLENENITHFSGKQS